MINWIRVAKHFKLKIEKKLNNETAFLSVTKQSLIFLLQRIILSRLL